MQSSTSSQRQRRGMQWARFRHRNSSSLHSFTHPTCPKSHFSSIQCYLNCQFITSIHLFVPTVQPAHSAGHTHTVSRHREKMQTPHTKGLEPRTVLQCQPHRPSHLKIFIFRGGLIFVFVFRGFTKYEDYGLWKENNLETCSSVKIGWENCNIHTAARNLCIVVKEKKNIYIYRRC